MSMSPSQDLIQLIHRQAQERADRFQLPQPRELSPLLRVLCKQSAHRADTVTNTGSSSDLLQFEVR